MDTKEYFEQFGAPDNMKITSYIALSLNGKEYTSEIKDITGQLKALDKKALGRYLGKKAGNIFDETPEEMMSDMEVGDKYEGLMLSFFELITDKD